MPSLDDRLKAVTEDLDGLTSKVQRLGGRLDAAKLSLTAIEKECRDRGVDPEKLDATISTLEGRYEELVAELESGLLEAQIALNPYLSESQ